MDDNDLLRRAYAALDRAVQAKGNDRHFWVEEALRLWRMARFDANASEAARDERESAD